MGKDKRHMKKSAGNIMIQILLVILAALFLFPFVWMLCTSLKTEAGIADYKQFPSALLKRAGKAGNF